MTIEERFWNKVSKNGSCWEWTARRNKDGYGEFSSGTQSKAHRYSYELHFGKIPKGVLVLHTCDNSCCVNPNHLYLGTDMDNAIDRMIRDRGARGERQGSAKLTEEDVIAIRVKYVPGRYSLQRLANEYKVCTRTIFKAITGRTWRRI